MSEFAVTETSFPDRTGWNTESKGSALWRTTRTYHLEVSKRPIEVTDVERTSGAGDPVRAPFVPFEESFSSCAENAEGVANEGWTEITTSLER